MIRTRSSALVSTVALAGAVALAACGGAAGGDAKAPAKTSEPESSAREREPTSVEEAQEQIARANADLSRDDPSKKADELDKDSVSRPSPGAGATSSTTTAKPSTPPSPREEPSRLAPADSCTQSCRALGSMRRAVSALCRMTGEEDGRCSEAKKTLQQSESRVARCHCSP